MNSMKMIGVGGVACLTVLSETAYYYYSIKRFPDEWGRKDAEGRTETFDDSTSVLIEKVMRRVNLSTMERSSLQVFLCSGHEPRHQGSLSLKFGVAIGFPKLLTYTSEQDVPDSDLPLGDQENHVTDGSLLQCLKKTMLLNEREKAFAIAKEICHTDGIEPCVNMLCQVLYGASAGLFMYYISRVFRRKTAALRLGLYGVIGVSQVFMYFYTFRAFRHYTDQQADKSAAFLTPYYAIGGLEYYTKLLERNKTLRQLLGKNGAEMYTPSGNVVGEEIKLTERKERMATIVELWEKGELEVSSRNVKCLVDIFQKHEEPEEKNDDKEL